MGGAFLEWALEAFSGYAAVDELYEGPYGVLSAVENRQDKRVSSDGSSPSIFADPFENEGIHLFCEL